jgi:hypothetical protein
MSNNFDRTHFVFDQFGQRPFALVTRLEVLCAFTEIRMISDQAIALFLRFTKSLNERLLFSFKGHRGAMAHLSA